MTSQPLKLSWSDAPSVRVHVSHTQTWVPSGSVRIGKSCGISGMEYSGGMEFSPAGASGSDIARSWSASARVHLAVKFSSGS
jgi:hypothetical protein